MDPRELFPVKRNLAYWNTAAVGPLSVRARDAVRGLVDDQCGRGAAGWRAWFREYDACRESAARLIGARPAEIALVPNTSAGLHAVARGLDWREGDNVVIPDREFPANVYPWTSLHGVEVRRVPKRGGALHAEDVARFVDGRTRVVSVSFVDWLTGHRADLAAVGRAAKAKGALFVVDAIQGLGALRLSVDECGIDALAADGHKWLCGPEGAGILYVREQAQETIAPSAPSWLSVKGPDFLPYDLTPYPTARRYEGGTPNTAGVFGLRAAIDLVLEAGIARIERDVLALAGSVRARARDLGIPVACEIGPGSGIVSLAVDGADAISRRLAERGCVVAAREGLLRVSAHWFNDDDELDRLFACAFS